MNPHSRARLGRRALPRFPGNTLFERIARTVCAAECLPRKELYEAWEVARRVRRRFHGGRVVDLACGHGLAAAVMLLLDDTSSEAVAVDTRLPKSARRLQVALTAEWPRLADRLQLVEGRLEDFALEPGDVVVSVHACGAKTDAVLEAAAAARARVAVLPCCQSLSRSDHGGLDGWLDGALAIDVTRASNLRAHGYRVWTQRIPEAITPKNRLLLGDPTR